MFSHAAAYNVLIRTGIRAINLSVKLTLIKHLIAKKRQKL